MHFAFRIASRTLVSRIVSRIVLAFSYRIGFSSQDSPPSYNSPAVQEDAKCYAADTRLLIRLLT